jgi:tRNA(Ile2) C34 agmatinyltransferase TiaS
VIEKEESYKVNLKGGSKTMNQYLEIEIGDETKEFRLLYISNQSLDERELYKWIKELESLSKQIPTISEINDKQRNIKEMVTMRQDSKQLQEKAAKQIEKRYRSNYRSQIFFF